MGHAALLKPKSIPMKKLPVFPFAGFREQSRRRKLHAAVSKLPVYEFERLAFTEVANLRDESLRTDTKVGPSKLRIRYR
jgi:hypothetical protein